MGVHGNKSIRLVSSLIEAYKNRVNNSTLQIQLVFMDFVNKK